MHAPDETLVWSGTPSQWVNAATFAVCTLIAAGFVAGAVLWGEPLIALGALLPAGVALWSWLSVRCTRFDVTSQRVSVRVGVLSRQRSDLELYRVKDTTLDEPLLLRLVSLANIQLESSDRSSPSMTIPALRDAEQLRQRIRSHVEEMRMLRRVRELDME